MEVYWKQRNNGTIPQSNIFTNKKLKEKCPDLLLDYYESKFNTYDEYTSSMVNEIEIPKP